MIFTIQLSHNKMNYKQNKTVLHKKKAYEIFWQTNYIEHINKNLLKSTLKHLDFNEIQINLPNAYLEDRKTYFLALFRIGTKIFQAICFFEKVKNHYRCIVKTAYQTTDQRIIQIAQNQNI